MTTVKSPAIFESAPVTRSRQPQADSAESTNEELTVLLHDCIEDGAGRYVELHIGELEETSIEPFLYRLLGVDDSTELFLGVSAANHGDLAYCRDDHGEPPYRVTLVPGATSVLDWHIWKAPATALWSGPLAGASLVLPAHSPQWVILTHPARGNPWLFPTHN